MKKWKTGIALTQDAFAVFEDSAQEGAVVETICLISPIDKMTEQDYKNAELIAAAPDLLEAMLALKELSDREDEPSVEEFMIVDNMFEAALVKAGHSGS